MGRSVNIAEWPTDEREALNVSLIAHRIRQECKPLRGSERQRKGRELLDALEPELRTRVIEKIKELAR